MPLELQTLHEEISDGNLNNSDVCKETFVHKINSEQNYEVQNDEISKKNIPNDNQDSFDPKNNNSKQNQKQGFRDKLKEFRFTKPQGKSSTFPDKLETKSMNHDKTETVTDKCTLESSEINASMSITGREIDAPIDGNCLYETNLEKNVIGSYNNNEHNRSRPSPSNINANSIEKHGSIKQLDNIESQPRSSGIQLNLPPIEANFSIVSKNEFGQKYQYPNATNRESTSRDRYNNKSYSKSNFKAPQNVEKKSNLSKDRPCSQSKIEIKKVKYPLFPDFINFEEPSKTGNLANVEAQIPPTEEAPVTVASTKTAGLITPIKSLTAPIMPTTISSVTAAPKISAIANEAAQPTTLPTTTSCETEELFNPPDLTNEKIAEPFTLATEPSTLPTCGNSRIDIGNSINMHMEPMDRTNAELYMKNNIDTIDTNLKTKPTEESFASKIDNGTLAFPKDDDGTSLPNELKERCAEKVPPSSNGRKEETVGKILNFQQFLNNKRNAKNRTPAAKKSITFPATQKCEVKNRKSTASNKQASERTTAPANVKKRASSNNTNPGCRKTNATNPSKQLSDKPKAVKHKLVFKQTQDINNTEPTEPQQTVLDSSKPLGNETNEVTSSPHHRVLKFENEDEILFVQTQTQPESQLTSLDIKPESIKKLTVRFSNPKKSKLCVPSLNTNSDSQSGKLGIKKPNGKFKTKFIPPIRKDILELIRHDGKISSQKLDTQMTNNEVMDTQKYAESCPTRSSPQDTQSRNDREGENSFEDSNLKGQILLNNKILENDDQNINREILDHNQNLYCEKLVDNQSSEMLEDNQNLNLQNQRESIMDQDQVMSQTQPHSHCNEGKLKLIYLYCVELGL